MSARRRKPPPPRDQLEAAARAAWEEFEATLSEADRRMFGRNPENVRPKRHVAIIERDDNEDGIDTIGKQVTLDWLAEQREPEPEPPMDLSPLTERERAATEYRHDGLSWPEIGRKLDVSPATARRALLRAAEKLGLTRKPEQPRRLLGRRMRARRDVPMEAGE